MDRRNFLKAGGGSMAGASLPAWARALETPGRGNRIAILHPPSTAPASRVAGLIVATIANVGLSAPERLEVDSNDIASAIKALTTGRHHQLLVLMDPAGTIIIGELARSLGLGLRWSGWHNTNGPDVRHHCTVAACSEGVTWRDDRHECEQRLANLYARILTEAAVNPPVPESTRTNAHPSFDLGGLILTESLAARYHRT